MSSLDGLEQAMEGEMQLDSSPPEMEAGPSSVYSQQLRGGPTSHFSANM